MVRRYEEPIEVQANGQPHGQSNGQGWEQDKEQATALVAGIGADHDRAGARPRAFVWRGRLYVVRSVLAHWQERRPWWRDALEPSHEGSDVLADARERHVWRVEASAGRMAGTGVYDLGADHSPRQWHLLRVAD